MRPNKVVDTFGIVDAESRVRLRGALSDGQTHELQRFLADLKRKEGDRRRKTPLSSAETAALELIPQILAERTAAASVSHDQTQAHAAVTSALDAEPPTPDMERSVEHSYANALARINGAAQPNGDELRQAMQSVKSRKTGAVYRSLLQLERTLTEALARPGATIEEYPDVLAELKSLLASPLRFSPNERLALIMAAQSQIDPLRVSHTPSRGADHVFRNLASELPVAAFEAKFLEPQQFATKPSLQNGKLADAFVSHLAGIQDLASEKRLRAVTGHRLARSEKDDGNTILAKQLHYLVASPDKPDDNVYFDTSPTWTTNQHTPHFAEDLLPSNADPSQPHFQMRRRGTPSGTFTYLDDQGRRLDPPKGISDALHERSIESQKTAIRLQNDLIRELRISCPEIANDPTILAFCPIIRKGDRLYLVHFERFHTLPKIPASLQRCDFAESQDIVQPATRDMSGHAKAFGLPVLYRVPTIDDVEAQLFRTRDIDGRFNVHDEDEPTDETHETEIGKREGESDIRDMQPIPRMESMVNVLLTERVSAEFSWDKDGKCVTGERCDFAKIQPGHYAIVTTDRGIRIVISNDPAKGTVILKNTAIPPEEFIGKIRTKDLIESHGGTTVQFHTPEQFEKALRTVIPAPGQMPKTVYPLDTHGAFRTPLDEGKFDTLAPDFEHVAKLVGKNPWELTPGDFASSVRSGDHEWTYGGAAHGTTFLQRLARDFGLSAVEAAKQDEELAKKRTEEGGEKLWLQECNRLRSVFARRILTTMLREIYPEARTSSGVTPEAE